VPSVQALTTAGAFVDPADPAGAPVVPGAQPARVVAVSRSPSSAATARCRPGAAARVVPGAVADADMGAGTDGRGEGAIKFMISPAQGPCEVGRMAGGMRIPSRRFAYASLT